MKKMGSAGLKNRSGRRIGSRPSRTPEERLRDRIAELEHKNKDLQMENDLLKSKGTGKEGRFLQYINYVNIRRLGNCPNQKDIPSDKCANTLGLLALPIIAGCKSWNFRQ